MKDPAYFPPISDGAIPSQPLGAPGAIPGTVPTAAPLRSADSVFESETQDVPPRAVAALFTERESAERAIRELKESSLYDASDIGVAMRDTRSTRELAEHTGTHATEGALGGVIGGGVLGGLAGWLVAVGALAIPGIGPVVAGGALASALGVTAGTAVAGAGIGAATGGIAGALIGLGIPEHHVPYYEEGLRAGGVIVTVRARNLTRAIEILRANGGTLHDPATGPGSVSTEPRLH